MDTDALLQAIYAAIDEVNDQLPKGRQLEKTPNAKLFDSEGVLDSLGLVNLIVAVEEQIESRLNTTVTLADEKAISQRNSPFRTVSTLVEYIQKQTQQAA